MLLLSLDDDLDLEKRGVGAKKVMLIKNVETVVENMKINEDVASEVSVYS